MTATLHKLPKPLADEAMPSQEQGDRDLGLGWRLWSGVVLAGLLVFGVGGWAATAKLAGAVISPGSIVVDGNIKKVQHPTGGIVGEIRVKNGDKVEAGDIVVRLDDTQTKASLGIVTSQLVELTGRRARLSAERDLATAIAFPEGFAEQSEEARRVAEGERRYYEARRRTSEGQKQQLQERIGQLREEISGISAQRDAKSRELELVRSELARVDDMYQRKLTPVTRVLAMQRDETRIAGEFGALVSQIARAKGRIAETELQIISIDETVQSDAQKELRDVEAKLSELRERKIAAEDMLKRVDIRAPNSGVVHELNFHTVGGVVNASEPLMLVVPNEDNLIIESRVFPADIDQLRLGQKAMLRFSAFSQRTTPEISGSVIRVAADLSQDEKTGEAYYRIRVKADETEMAKLGGLELVPGMPVEVFIQTGERSALSYFVKPLTDQFARAFRED